MPGGRPSDYSKEKLQLARDYLENYSTLGDVVPQIAGLAIHVGVARSTVYLWAEDEEKGEFSDIVEEVLSAQEGKLVNGGLLGDFNASIAKLALAKHGYTEKSETTLQGAGGGPVEVSYNPVRSDGRRKED